MRGDDARSGARAAGWSGGGGSCVEDVGAVAADLAGLERRRRWRPVSTISPRAQLRMSDALASSCAMFLALIRCRVSGVRLVWSETMSASRRSSSRSWSRVARRSCGGEGLRPSKCRSRSASSRRPGRGWRPPCRCGPGRRCRSSCRGARGRSCASTGLWRRELTSGRRLCIEGEEEGEGVLGDRRVVDPGREEHRDLELGRGRTSILSRPIPYLLITFSRGERLVDTARVMASSPQRKASNWPASSSIRASGRGPRSRTISKPARVQQVMVRARRVLERGGGEKDTCHGRDHPRSDAPWKQKCRRVDGRGKIGSWWGTSQPNHPKASNARRHPYCSGAAWAREVVRTDAAALEAASFDSLKIPFLPEAAVFPAGSRGPGGGARNSPTATGFR